ncbi:MAG: tetratricopeptide repeat protein [Planctomycetota bacterium]
MKTRWLRLARWGAAALVVLVIGVLYGPTLGYPLIYDDKPALLENATLKPAWALPGPWLPPEDSPLSSRPLSNFSLSVTYAVSGIEPWGHRLGNVILHAAGAVILLLGLERAARLGGLGRWAAWGAAAGAAGVWAAHPLVTEAVVYVTQRTELMVSVAAMGSVALLLGGAREGRVGRWWLAGSVGCCAAAMASKEMAYCLPVVLLSADRGLVAGTWRGALRVRWAYYAALAATWGALVGSMAASGRGKSVGFHHGTSGWEYLLTQSEVLAHYARMAVWPTGMQVVYEWPIAESLAAVWPTFIGVGAAAVVSFAAWFWCKRWGWGAAWVWLWLAPTSSVLPIITEVAADRRMYLPLAILLGLASTGIAAWIERRTRASTQAESAERGGSAVAWGAGGLAVLLVVGGAIGSAARLTVFADRVTVWEDAVAKDPRAALPWNALANALLDRGEMERAELAFQEALDRDPAYWKSLRGLGMIAAARGMRGDERRYETEALIARIEPILDEDGARRLLDPELTDTAYRAGVELVASYPTVLALDIITHLGGHWVELGELRRAEWTLRRAAEINSAHPAPWASLGAVALRSGRPGEAIELLDRAEALGGLDSGGATTMGLALIDLDRLEPAETWLRRAVAMDPRATVAWRGLSTALRRQGDVGGALRAAEHAVAVGGSDAGAWNSLGIALATVGDMAEAEKAWRIALELDPEHAGARANLDKLLGRMGGSALSGNERRMPPAEGP